MLTAASYCKPPIVLYASSIYPDQLPVAQQKPTSRFSPY